MKVYWEYKLIDTERLNISSDLVSYNEELKIAHIDPKLNTYTKGVVERHKKKKTDMKDQEAPEKCLRYWKILREQLQFAKINLCFLFCLRK